MPPGHTSLERTNYVVVTRKEKRLDLTRGSGVMHYQRSSHDGVQRTMVGIGSRREMADRIGLIGSEWARIEGTMFTTPTGIMGNGVKVVGGVFPRDRSPGQYLDHLGRIIGRKGPNRDSQG